jgi:type I restriction enzyme S subunit
MTVDDEWVSMQIRDLFESSIPGDWGLEGTPDNGIPVLRSTNFRNDGSIDYSDIAYRRIEERRLKRRLISPGSILIEKSGGSSSQAAGRVVYCDREFNGTASNFIEIARVKESFSSRYVAFLLQYLYQIGLVFKYQQQTTGIINFRIDEYFEESVDCPASKHEQAQIAKVLSTVDQAIEQTEALVAKQQRIKAGLMQDLLTRGIDEHGSLRSEETHQFKDSSLGRIPVEWEVKQLSEIVDEGITYGIVQAGPHIDEGIPYIRTGDMTGDAISVEQLVRTSEKIAKSYRRSTVFSGDIVFALRATVGKVLPVSTELEGANLTQGTAKISPKESVDPTFLLWALRSSSVQDQIRVHQKGTTFAEITLGELRNIEVALPKDYQEQSYIAERLTAHDNLRRQYVLSLEKLHSLKTALMQDLLTGKKRVTPL